MLNTVLKNPVTGCTLDSRKGFEGHCTFVTESLLQLNALWKAETNNAAETVNIITPVTAGSILITDLIITSSKKVASSTIVIQFSDGVNTVVCMEIEAATAPVQFSHSFTGGLRGWEDAILQVVTDQAAMHVTTLVSYIKVAETLTKSYAEWHAER